MVVCVYGGQVQVRSCDDRDFTILMNINNALAPPPPPPPTASLPFFSYVFPPPPHPSQVTTLYGCTVRIYEPVGVIGIACTDESPLLALSPSLPLLLSGATPSSSYPVRSTHCLWRWEWPGVRLVCDGVDIHSRAVNVT